MFNLVSKDFLTLSKNRSDLLQLLFMPFILIAILGLALGSILTSDTGIEAFPVGLVDQQSIEEDLDRFEEELRNEGLPEVAVAEISSSAEDLDPASVLTDLLQEEGLEEVILLEEYSEEEEALTALEEEEIAGYINIPENFSYTYWRAIFLEEEAAAQLDLVVESEGGFASSILKGIVSAFADQFNMETSIALATDSQAEPAEDSLDYGETMHLSVEEPVSAFQYYTIGMGVMFALFTAPVLAARAYQEKEEHVFGRMMLSNMRPLKYLTSKLISGTLITFVQLLILFLLSTLIFGTFQGRDFDFWLDMISITAFFALVVGGITSLLTALALNAGSITTVNFFSSFISILAFLGGSFTRVDQFSETLKEIGNWTPNGAAMTSYLQVIQGFDFQETLPLMLRVIAQAVVAILLSLIVFPKRRLD